ncbi:MAG: hypothetical protein HQL69_22220 [Magnetococcales bacterium]|nr:hypothetical protein [Magnetococcales bacterium]
MGRFHSLLLSATAVTVSTHQLSRGRSVSNLQNNPNSTRSIIEGLQTNRSFGVLILSLLALLLVVPIGPAQGEYADVVLNEQAEKEGVRPVIYPHWFHRIRFRCKVCHSELGFEMRVGANKIDMAAITDGKFCGACHTGDVAWGLEFCDRCHSGLPGLKTGIKSGSKSGGPGFY